MNRKRASINRVLLWVVSVCVVAGFTTHAYSDTLASKVDANTIILAVTPADDGNVFVDTVVIIENGNYTDPSESFGESFIAKYFRAGQKYWLLVGGGKAGTVTIKKSEGIAHCGTFIKTVATVRLQESYKDIFERKGVATNSLSLGVERTSRRAPTAGERAAMLELAKEVYREKAVPVALLQRLVLKNLTVADLDGDGIVEMIGNFLIEDKRGDGVNYSLFLISRMNDKISQMKGKRLQPEFVWYYESGDVLDKGYLEQELIDLVDLDRDGRAEVITYDLLYEGYQYTIYKKEADAWESIYEGGGEGC